MKFDINFSKPEASRARRDDQPMRICVLAAFRGHTESSPLAERRPISVDAENFDDVMERIAPRLDIESAEGKVELTFRSLEDFHPDRLIRELGPLREMHEMRARVANPKTFPRAAAELGVKPADESVDESAAGKDEEAPPKNAPSEGSAFEQLLGDAKSPASGKYPDAGSPARPAENLIREIVSPFVVPDADPRQDAVLESVDRAISDAMRRLLHAPAFQALESTWRSLERLVTELSLGEELEVHILDVTRDELILDFESASGDPLSSSIYRILVEKCSGTFGGQPWSVIAGDYEFTEDALDLALLVRLGALASQAGGPFIGGASSRLLGSESLDENSDPATWNPLEEESEALWQTLRESPAAPWIGLALPRILLRLPYGKLTDAIESFEFEEMPETGDHRRFLWGNSAYACALLIALGFEENGWSTRPGDALDIEDLPSYVYKENGDSKQKPCAEVELPDSVAETILGRGIMPLLSDRRSNRAHLPRFQSIAKPTAALQGAWAR